MPRRQYLGGSVPTHLSANIDNVVTSFDINAITRWPSGGANGPFNMTIDAGLSTEEHVTVGSRTGNTCSSVVRGQDNTTAQAHTVGADGTVVHGWFAQDADDANRHIYVVTHDDHTQYMKADGTRHDLTARHPAGTVVPQAVPAGLTVGAVQTLGAGTNLANANHVHAVPTGTPSSIGTALAAGTSNNFPHLDHVHNIGTGAINLANMFNTGVIDSAALGANSVIAGKIATGGVSTSAQIADAIVSLVKFASEASTDYTPTAASFANTTTLTIGTGGTTYGHHYKLGRLVVGWAGFSMAADGNLPAGGNIQIPLPVAMRTVGSDGFRCFVAARARRGSDGNVVSGTGVITGGSSNAVNIAAAGTAATWDATTPFNWGTPGDGACVIDSVFVYEAAT